MNIAIPEIAKKRIDTAIDHTNEARKIINDRVVSALELTHNVLMAGLGGLDLTTEISREFSRKLIERGETSDNTAVAQARKVVDLLPRELHIDVAVPAVPHVDEVRQKAENAVEDAVAEVKRNAEEAVQMVEERVEAAKEGAVKGVEKVLHGLPDVVPVPRKNLDSLVERVEGLAGRIDILKSKREKAVADAPAEAKAAPAPAKAKAAAPAKAAAKKTTPRKKTAAKPAAKAATAKKESPKPRRRTAAPKSAAPKKEASGKKSE